MYLYVGNDGYHEFYSILLNNEKSIMKKSKFVSLFVLLTCLLSGCASIVSKSSYTVMINSVPSEAKITITDKKGVNVYEGLSPSIVKLDASSGFFSKASYLVKFEKEGYQLKTCQITSKIDGWYFGNILLGGLIGMLIVDPATGAMYKLDTDAVDVSLMPERTVSIIDIQSLPDEMKNHLVLLENN